MSHARGSVWPSGIIAIPVEKCSLALLQFREQRHQVFGDPVRRANLEIAAARAPRFVAAELVMLRSRQVAVVTIGQRDGEVLRKGRARLQVEADLDEHLAGN